VRDSYQKLTDEQDVEWNYLAKYIKLLANNVVSVEVVDRFDDISNKNFNALLIICNVLAVVGILDGSIRSDFTIIKSRCHTCT